MPRGRGRGKRGSHKGGHKHFTNAEELQSQIAKQKKEKEWRQMKGIPSDEEDEEGGDGEAKAAAPKPTEDAEVGFEDDSETESESEEEEEAKAKGVSHLIEVANPNHAMKLTKKVTDLTPDTKTQLTRKEREELEKQQAKVQYQQLHQAGKTDEARADMARLALIRKQREDAQKKRDEDKKEKDAAASAAEERLRQKKAAARQ